MNTLQNTNIEPYTGYPHFDFMIGNTPISNNRKIAYIHGLETGKTKDAIHHFHGNGQFFIDAPQELERKFGKSTTIVIAYVQQFLDHQPPITGHPDLYINYTTFIKGIIRNLQHLGHTADLESTTNFRHAIKKIPTTVLIRWQQHIVNRHINRSNLITFCNWLKRIAEAYEVIEDGDNQQLHTLQSFTTQTCNSEEQRINKSFRNLPSRRWTTPIFQVPIFHRT